MFELDLVTQSVASLLTLAGVYLLWTHSRWGSLVSLAAQVPWWVLILRGHLWGLLPLEIGFSVLYSAAVYRDHIQSLLRPTPLVLVRSNEWSAKMKQKLQQELPLPMPALASDEKVQEDLAMTVMPEMTATELVERKREHWKTWQAAEARILEPLVNRALEIARQELLKKRSKDQGA